VPPRGRDDAVDRGEVVGMVELARDPHEVGEIEVPEPQDVDAGQRGDVVGRRDAAGRLDQRDQQVARRAAAILSTGAPGR
jgi:hypothetical protein